MVAVRVLKCYDFAIEYGILHAMLENHLRVIDSKTFFISTTHQATAASYPPYPLIPHGRRPGKVQRYFQQGLSAGLVQNPVGGDQVQFLLFYGDSIMGQGLDQFVDLPQV